MRTTTPNRFKLLLCLLFFFITFFIAGGFNAFAVTFSSNNLHYFQDILDSRGVNSGIANKILNIAGYPLFSVSRCNGDEIYSGVQKTDRNPTAPYKKTSGFSGLDYAALVIYLLALVSIGIYLAGREKGTEDFFLAGRRIPWWAAGISIFGTQLSAITFMAIPAKAYTSNWQFFLMNMGIVAIAPIIVFFFLPFYSLILHPQIQVYLRLRSHWPPVSRIQYQLYA